MHENPKFLTHHTEEDEAVTKKTVSHDFVLAMQ